MAQLNTKTRSDNADTRRSLKSFTGLTSVGATGVYTLGSAGFLDDLQLGDAVVFSTLTGGTGIVAGTTYYLLGAKQWPVGQLTFQVSATPLGDPVVGGTNVTVGTVSAGSSDFPGNYVSQDSPRGR